jgi:hypothetical protein
MTNNNRNLVQDLQKQLIDKVLSFMNEKDLNMVEFNTPFRIFVEEPSFDDYVMIPLASRYLYRDGSIGADGEEVKIENCSIYEIAYIMDVLEGGHYTVDDDDEFIDPAGGRGLQSHI